PDPGSEEFGFEASNGRRFTTGPPRFQSSLQRRLGGSALRRQSIIGVARRPANTNHEFQENERQIANLGSSSKICSSWLRCRGCGNYRHLNTEALQSANQRPLELLGVTSVEVVCSDLLQIET